MPGLEISLPGGGSKNSKTGKITPPKKKVIPTPKATGTAAMNGAQYDAYLKKVYADMKKTKR